MPNKNVFRWLFLCAALYAAFDSTAYASWFSRHKKADPSKSNSAQSEQQKSRLVRIADEKGKPIPQETLPTDPSFDEQRADAAAEEAAQAIFQQYKKRQK